MRRRVSKPSSPFSPALRRLGLASPPPFVGRAAELAALEEALADSVLIVVSGAVGSGKSRLVEELCRGEAAARLGPAWVRCLAGDRGEAVRARAERELGALPGTLDEHLRDEPRLLVIDDAHRLADAPDTLRRLAREPGAGRVILLASERLPLRRAQSQRFEITLDGLDEAAARELWSHLEETYGPTKNGDCDQALLITGGMPQRLRREYARAACGAAAWSTAELPEGSRAVIEILAVLDLPVAPAGLAAMLERAGAAVDLEAALLELVTRQLAAPLADGRFCVHDEVRDMTLEALGERRAELEAQAAAQLHLEGERGTGGFGALDPVDRLREATRHWIAAGELERAAEAVAAGFDEAATRGSAGEITALAHHIEALAPELAPRLRAVRARAERRRGASASALELGGTGDPVTDGWLAFVSGDVETARQRLEELAASGDAAAARAAAYLALIEVEAAGLEAAAERIASAFERGGDALSAMARAHLHLASAAAAVASGDPSAARAALARARGAGDIGAEMTCAIDLFRARLLAAEGRSAEAGALLEDVAARVIQLDLGVLTDEVMTLRALLAARSGDLAEASGILRRLVARHRERGNEVPALRAELDLAEALLRRGELSAAAELAVAAGRGAGDRGLEALRWRAALIGAEVDLAVVRIGPARAAIESLADSGPPQHRARLDRVAELAAAAAGEAGSACEPSGDAIADAAHSIRVAVARRDTVRAIELCREQAAAAERAGRLAELVESLAVLSRLRLARGDRAGATAAASRAAREALDCGMTAARADALLVLAALARDNGELTVAQAYAQDSAELAAGAGLPLHRLAAARAMEVIAVGDAGGVAEVAEREAAAAAALSEEAVEATAQLLADLGLTSARPYRVVSAAGGESFVADASPSVLRMEERDLVIDAVRELIVRGGSEIADLRRRSLLKRLLFLFARSPGQVFSKEEIVQSVWEVDYHPLRHDAALFTNIMRIRRLLGEDGADLIRVSDEGYRFCPDKDFLYVEHVPE